MLDVEIDGFFNSIRRVSDGVIVATRIVEWADLSSRQIASLSTWLFQWLDEAEHLDKRVFALFASGSPVVQGMMSSQEMDDHVYIYLLENAPRNVGKQKKFEGIPANLVGFACLRSRLLGMHGAVAFDAKTELIDHYKRTLGATQLGRSARMIFDVEASLRLVDRTYRGNDKWPV